LTVREHPGSGARQDELWRDLKRSGNGSARDRLVLAYAPLVREVAVRTWRGLPAFVDLGDLVSDGYVGLMDAVEKFDPQRGCEFRAYAAPRIRGAILDGLRAADWVPRSVRRTARDLTAATSDAEHRLGRTPHDGELAAQLGVPMARLQAIKAQNSYAKLVRLDPELDDRPIPSSYDEDDGGSGVGVRDAVRQLPDREQWVIGLSYWGHLTLTEIGQVLGVSESRVCQLRSRATAALRLSLAPAS
jgi:RNA polymerase sigma factor for flagellar operon FliA